MSSKQIFLFCLRAHKIQLTYSEVIELTHMVEECYTWVYGQVQQWIIFVYEQYQIVLPPIEIICWVVVLWEEQEQHTMKGWLQDLKYFIWDVLRSQDFPYGQFYEIIVTKFLGEILGYCAILEPLFLMVHLSSRAFDIFGLCIGIKYDGEWGHRMQMLIGQKKNVECVGFLCYVYWVCYLLFRYLRQYRDIFARGLYFICVNIQV